MNPSRSDRGVQSSWFKALVLGERKQPGVSVAAVAIAPRMPPLQFVPVELAKSEHRQVHIPASQPDIRIELEGGGLRLNLQCSATAGPANAALLRALADRMVAA